MKALERLRAAMDAAHEGDRERWLGVLGPLAAPGEGSARAWPRVALLTGAAGIAAAIGVALGPAARTHHGRADVAPAHAAASSAGEPNHDVTPSRPERARAAAAKLAVVLPTLAAAADGEQPIDEQAAFAACVELQQRAIRCGGELAALTMARLGAQGTNEGCKRHVQYRTFTRAESRAMQVCTTAGDCAEFAACARRALDKLLAPPKATFDLAQAIAARGGPSALPVVVDDQVMEQLDQLVGTNEARERTRQALERMRAHDAVVGDTLAAHGVPREVAAVALIESDFETDAVSKRGAAGLWQLMKETAAQQGLVVDEHRDERLDPGRATAAAAALLRDLYARFGDWNLALAAYNRGARAIDRIIAEAGTRDVAELQARGYLRGYSARVMAAVLVMREPSLAD